MIKVIKKVILSSLSILGLSVLFWTVLFLNPNLSYANKTEFGKIAVYHNQNLEESVESILKNAMKIVETSVLYDEHLSIQLCLNDDKIYPHLHPLAGQPLAFAAFNKTIVKNCKINFSENIAETRWAVNNYELRRFDLTYLLAHEFVHNFQYHANSKYFLTTTIGKLNWKLEGHAEYIARAFKNDKALKDKIKNYLIEENKEHSGLPVFELEDGTKQIFSYYKYALVIQYLM